jgi:predicted secreted protein
MRSRLTLAMRAATAAGVALIGPMALAQTLAAPPQNVVTLTATATVEVPKDWLTVVFSTTREGPDAALVQGQLKQALDAALGEARKAARPGLVEVQTGTFSLVPRYAPAGGKPSGAQPGILGWAGTTELVVEGRDTSAIAQLTGRVQTLSIARVTSSLSREARQRVEGDVTAQAIDNFRGKAEAVARQFGFGGWALREVAVQSDPGQPTPMPLMRSMAMARSTPDESLPVEVGKSTLTATVNGSVQLK